MVMLEEEKRILLAFLRMTRTYLCGGEGGRGVEGDGDGGFAVAGRDDVPY